MRELSNLAQFFIFANRTGVIELTHLPSHFGLTHKGTKDGVGLEQVFEPGVFDLAFSKARNRVEEIFEKAYFERNLTKYEWNVSLTAEKTGADRRTVHRMIKKLHLTRPA